MSITWILIANASKALLYSTHKARLFQGNGRSDNLSLIEEFSHEQSRKKTGDLVSDRVGRYQTGNAGHGSFSEATDPKEYEAEVFARELVAELEAGRVAGKYNELIIVATPHFQGLLKKHLNGSINNLVTRTISKDYTQYSKRQLAQQLMEQL